MSPRWGSNAKYNLSYKNVALKGGDYIMLQECRYTGAKEIYNKTTLFNIVCIWLLSPSGAKFL
jgi:hypothetical protein